jgi:hypothetical protein
MREMATLTRLIGIGLLVAACTSLTTVAPGLVALKTQPPGSICLQALTVGPLVADPASGVALGSPAGPHLTLIWPAGWTDRADNGSIAILDANGTVVAHVGDTVSMGGGGPDPWFVCPPVTVVGPSPAAS